jgi:hypothetical protein
LTNNWTSCFLFTFFVYNVEINSNKIKLLVSVNRMCIINDIVPMKLYVMLNFIMECIGAFFDTVINVDYVSFIYKEYVI